jgi:hypothetical protein
MNPTHERATERDENVPQKPHLDKALPEVDVPGFEDELELWTTYGGD